jgi:hypothetical protein
MNTATALEHLAKACLAKRSPALLTELRREENYSDLLQLLGLAKGGATRPLHTVGLRGALERVRVFVAPQVPWDDLILLAGLRDGTVHAAMNNEVGTRLLVAFVGYADELILDLGHDRKEFWGGQLAVVDALLADASDKTKHDVAVKIAAARAYFERQFGGRPDEMVALVRRFEEPRGDDFGEVRAECPACESLGLARGYEEVEWEPDEWKGGRPVSMRGVVWFTPWSFECFVCRMELASAAEIEAADMPSHWKLEGADPRKYDEPPDEDSFYEAYRDRYH